MSEGKVLDLEEYRKGIRRNWDPLTVATEELGEAVTELKDVLIELFPEGFVDDANASVEKPNPIVMLPDGEPPPSAG